MPSMSFSGNMTPTSMINMLRPYSSTIMFFPISPRPPRGMMRSVFAIVCFLLPKKNPGEDNHFVPHRATCFEHVQLTYRKTRCAPVRNVAHA